MKHNSEGCLGLKIGSGCSIVVSSPRPSCPPARRVTPTKDEKENAMEWNMECLLLTLSTQFAYLGIVISSCFFILCFSFGVWVRPAICYLLHYIVTYTRNTDTSMLFVGFAMVCLFVGLIGFGRMYLGMHSLADIIGGLAFRLVILAFCLTVHEYIDNFVVSGQNVTSFWAALRILLLFAYPTPENPTPSFENHTSFTDVAFGIVSGVQQTYHQFHHENVARIFTPQLTLHAFAGRMLVGVPTILLVKFCTKALGNSYKINQLHSGANSSGTLDEVKQSGYLQKLFFFSPQASFDVDTGIRFLQYAALAWSVVDLVPYLSYLLRL